MQAANQNQTPQQLNRRVLDIDGAINFRDLGGYQTHDGRKVKWGQIYRSAQLDRLTEKGVADMAALSIKAVVDLRFSDESARYPTIKAAVPEAEMLSWHDEPQEDSSDRSQAMKRSWKDSLDSNDPAQVREAMRINYPQKLYSHRAIYRKVVLRLAEGKTPLVFHCAAGKDRTGVAAALILSLLGVPDELIVEDYLLTQEQIKGLMDAWLTGGAADAKSHGDLQSKLVQHSRETVQPIFDADETYIATLMDYVDKQYGGFFGYAERALNLDKSTLIRFQSNLLQL